MELMIVLFLLVLINLFIAMGRQQPKKWIRYVFNTVSSILLLATLIVMLRCLR